MARNLRCRLYKRRRFSVMSGTWLLGHMYVQSLCCIQDSITCIYHDDPSAGASASMLIGQVPGGFLSSKYPLCSGQESTLSVCSMETRSEGQGECAYNKALVRCYMKSVDTSTCGISTESSSTVTGSATIEKPFTTTRECMHCDPTTSFQFIGTRSTNSSFSERITSTVATEGTIKGNPLAPPTPEHEHWTQLHVRRVRE